MYFVYMFGVMLILPIPCLFVLLLLARGYESSEEQVGTWCRRFEPGGSLSRRVNVPRAPAQMGRARGRARRGEARWPEMGVREVEIPWPSCSSRAQVGCACSRGLQASTREREASGPKRAPVPSSSPRGQPSLRGPWSFLLSA